jgi:hypothetical protein
LLKFSKKLGSLVEAFQRIEELVVQPAGGFFGNPVWEEMGVGLRGGGKLSKLHELLLSGSRQLS